MLQKIITLPKQLANQIAAGEVVERPLSVVKELVENSLDAGATEILISLKNGWIDDIIVKDNGEWIPWNQLKLALEKYSTSKIKTLEDLYEVMTFGFRWEALASISSVSEFRISSKTLQQAEGVQIKTQGGEDISQEIIAHDRGTTVQVSQLFFNTPARLAYLKTPRTEYLKIQEFVQKIALIYPHVWISLSHDEKWVYNFPLGQNIDERIYEIFWSEFSENMRKLQHEFSGVKVSGYISDPTVSFKNKSRQLLFVNKRVINSPMIAKALYDAYNRFIPHGSQPWYILSIDVDPTQVDVNVHPRKMEVRFAGEATIFRSVFHGVKDELERVSLVSNSWHQNLTSNLSSGQREQTSEASKYYTGSGTKFKSYSPYKNTATNPSQASIDFTKQILSPWKHERSLYSGETTDINKHYTSLNDLRDTPLWKIVGQIHNSYIVVETSFGLQILDQHALAERVIYEKLASSAYTPKVQWILWSVWMHLSGNELEILEQYSEEFEKMGFEIEILSQGNILISSIPDFMSGQNIEKSFQKILWDMSGTWSLWLEEIRHKIWAYTACRSAIKFWDKLSIFEMNKLLHDAAIDYSATCPHGRPVVYDISLEDLLGKYER